MSQKDREDDTSENVCHRKIERMSCDTSENVCHRKIKRMILVKMYVTERSRG